MQPLAVILGHLCLRATDDLPKDLAGRPADLNRELDAA